MPSIRSLIKAEIVILAAGLVLVGLGMGATLTVQRVFLRVIPLAQADEYVVSQLAQAHVDTQHALLSANDAKASAFDSLTRALAVARAMRDDGATEIGYIETGGFPAVRADAAALVLQIEKLEQAAQATARTAAQNAGARAVDAEYEAAYDAAVAATRQLRTSVQTVIQTALRDLVNYGILFSAVTVILCVALLVMWRRNRAHNAAAQQGLTDEIQQRNAALLDERNLLRTLIDNMPDLIYAKDRDSRFILANPGVAKAMGVAAPEALLGKTDFDFHAPELAREFRADEEKLMASGVPLIDKQESVREPSGRTLWLSSTKVPLRDAQGNIIGLVGINRDVTAERENDARLLASETQYRRIVENAHEGIVMTNAAHRIVYHNQRATEILGFASEELLGNSPLIIAPPHDYAAARARLQAREDGARGEGDFPFVRKDGTAGWMHLIANPIRDDFGNFAGTLYMFTDITERRVAEEQARAKEDLYRSLVEALPQSVFRKDTAGHFTFANGRFAEMLGVLPEEITGKTDFDFVPRALAEKYQADDRAVMASGSSLEQVEEFETPNGERRIVRTIKTPLWDANGMVSGLQGMFWDITEGRLQYEQNRTLSRAVEAGSDAIVIANRAGSIEYVNSACMAVSGYSAAELVGQNLRFVTCGDAAEYDTLWQTICGGQVWRGEFQNRNKRGEWYWESASISPILDDAGELTHFVVVKQDITARKHAEEKLHRQNEFLDALHETTLGLMGRLDITDLLHALTHRAAKLVGTEHGYSYFIEPGRVEMAMNVGIGIFEKMVGTIAHHGVGLTGKVWETGELMVIDDYVTWQGRVVKSGSENLRSIVGIPLKSGTQVIGVFGVAYTDPQRSFDETSVAMLTRFAQLASIALDNARLYAAAQQELAERERANEQLRAQQELLSNVLNTVEDGIYIVDRDGKMTFANPATERMVGVTRQELATVTYNDARWKTTTLDGAPFPEEEQPYVRVMTTGAPVRDVEQRIERPDGQQIIVSINAAPLHDAEGNVIGEVASLTDITARKRAEEQVRRQNEMLQAVIDTIPVMIGVYNETGRFSLVNREWEDVLGYTLADINQMDVLNALYPDAEQRAEIRRMLTTPTRGWHDFSTTTRSGAVIDTSWSVAHLSDGKLIVFGQDITKRKEVDRLKNEFISTVSHELRTPLTSIRGSLGLIAGGVAGAIPERAKGMIEIAYKNSERLVRLINDILDIEKIESGKMVFQFKPLALMPLVEQALEANRGFAEQYQVTLHLTETAPEVQIHADADRMTQVLTNLLSNAVKFSPPGGRVEVSVQRRAAGVRVAVRDHGAGIPPEFQTRIFQKFAQADASDSRQKGGTGLGLAITKAIVEKHGGAIAFKTTPGQGTTFYFELPEWNVAASAPFEDAPKRPRILVCEDDHDVALLLSLMLRHSGFDADIAYNAMEAKRLLAREQYAALTLDLMLPDEDGITLIRELRAADATRALPIVVVSAIAEQGRQQLNGDAMWVADWLQKPIEQDRLVHAVSVAAQRGKNGKPHLLHVEDDADVLQVVKAILHDIAVVSAARNLTHAREMLRTHRYDLVILDPTLPDGSGLDLLPLLREQRNQVPVVLFSANDNDPQLLNRVNAALVKSRTSNQELLDTITGLIQISKIQIPEASHEPNVTAHFVGGG